LLLAKYLLGVLAGGGVSSGRSVGVLLGDGGEGGGDGSSNLALELEVMLEEGVDVDGLGGGGRLNDYFKPE